MNYSKTFAGIISSYLVAIGLLSEAEALNLVNAIVMLVPILYAAYGRVRAGGVDWLGRK